MSGVREASSWRLGTHGDVVESGPRGERVLFNVSLASAVDPGEALEGLLARASAWEAMREALDRNAAGGSAADVCAVGFEQQDRLVRDGQLGVRAEPEPTASDDLADGSKGCYMIGSADETANLARSILYDALGYHDDPDDPVGIAYVVAELHRGFAQAIANTNDAGWAILVADVQRWAVEQIPALADMRGLRHLAGRGWDPGG